MKIKQSAVAMEGSSSYSSYQKTQTTSILVRPQELEKAKKLRQERQKEQEESGVDVSISDKSKSLLGDLLAEKENTAKERQKKLAQGLLSVKENNPVGDISYQYDAGEDQMLQTLRQLLDMLRRLQRGDYSLSDVATVKQSVRKAEVIQLSAGKQVTLGNGGLSIAQSQSLSLGKFSASTTVVDMRSAASVNAGVGTSWIRHTETNRFVMEQESATFSAQGLVKTSDGREISFDVDLSMSRGFAGNLFSSKDEKVVLTDPLVVNLESNSATVSNQKFFFDLDADGKEESISRLGEGSGFLAYDKNGDGKINDGSELFGTKSGDGFKDLAAYDQDGNGWIDENDAIFGKLKVWTKDAEGKDKLLDLKEANVGAIYLGNVDTRMHLKDGMTNQTNGVIRKTGVFLRETGEAGTIQHVDLAV